MLALCLLKNHAMRAYGEVQTWFHAFVKQTVVGGVWSGLRLEAPCARKELPMGYEVG
jgi:hypothetical protein